MYVVNFLISLVVIPDHVVKCLFLLLSLVLLPQAKKMIHDVIFLGHSSFCLSEEYHSFLVEFLPFNIVVCYFLVVFNTTCHIHSYHSVRCNLFTSGERYLSFLKILSEVVIYYIVVHKFVYR